MKVAAYQAPLLTSGSMGALDLIQEQVTWCETRDISVLCCPEAILGGLADYSRNPDRFAIKTDDLTSVLSPLTSQTVAVIVGFTELALNGQIYNTTAIFHKGRVVGLYRKLHPAIRRSVYSAGTQTPVFRIGDLTFGIVICYDSTFAEPARRMAAQNAIILFVPTNNGLPDKSATPELVKEARNTDIARAIENRMWIVRADVVGQNGELTSYGSSGIVDPVGNVVQEAKLQSTDLLVVDIEPHDESNKVLSGEAKPVAIRIANDER